MKRNVDELADICFDVLVLGGGITGAGVALDAALRGFRVALIDKGDFASGTSSVSSKLIHGGLRYLEYAAFPLVSEALAERARLLRNAPHLVRPLRFILPFYRDGRLHAWQWRLGLTVYDLLAGKGNIRRSRPIGLRELGRECPFLQAQGLVGGSEFYDAQMDDARLCLEVIRSAAAQGACVANYVEATGFEIASGRIQSVRALDRISGRELVLRARQVVNATGPWVDAICRLAGDASGPHLQPTKGVHIVLPPRSTVAAFLLLHPADGRVFFVLPWMGKTLVGTTDTFVAEGPDALRVLPEEVAYLLDGYNHYLRPPHSAADVLGSLAGLRPLLRTRAGDPSSITREFQILASPSGLLSVAGGKYTTYRHMAELIVDEVCRRLGRRRSCRTHDFSLDGAPVEPLGSSAKAISRVFGVSSASAAHLVNRYGRRVADVIEYLDKTPDAAQVVVPGEPDLRREFLYQKDHEMALFPADHLLRRTRLGLFHPELLHSSPEATKEPRG